MNCRTEVREDCLVIRPQGRLDLTTYAELRDRLLKYAVEQPRALIVDLADLVVESEPLLSVFATVWLRTNDWPAVPLLLVANADRVPQPTALRRYVAVHDTVEGAIAAVGAPPPRRRTEQWLPCDPTSPSVARGFVRDNCADWGLVQEDTTDAVVIAAELVTNAVNHACSDARLRMELRGGMLTVAVSDDDPRPAVLRESAVLGPRSGGYGMLLIAQLAVTWGCVSDHERRGKVVWAVLRTTSHR